MNKLCFIGAGNMGSAMISGVVNANIIDANKICVSNKSAGKLIDLNQKLKVNTTTDNKKASENSDVVILAVKPHIIPLILEEIKDNINKETIVISVAAGVTISDIEKITGTDRKILRVMPNTPCLVGEGMSAICPNENINDDDLKIVKDIFNSFGKSEVIDESLMDCVIGVSGSSPAYVFMFMEAMADAAVQTGMKRDMAYKFVAQSVLGASKMLMETHKHPGELKDMVCSPAGTTIKAVEVLEKYGLKNAVIQAQLACVEKSREMSAK